MKENSYKKTIINMLETRYSFLKWSGMDFSFIIPLIDSSISLEENLILCEEAIAGRILDSKNLYKNITLVKKYIKNLRYNKDYNSVQKLRLIGLLFSNIQNIRNNTFYNYLMQGNNDLKNIASSVTEKEFNKLLDDKYANYIFQDVDKYSYEEEKHLEVKSDNEFSEIIKTYKDTFKGSLTKEEERELIIKAKAKDKHAKEVLVGYNWKLVLSIVRKYLWMDNSIADLFQEGNVGLLKAIDMFEVERNVRLSTYASWWIKSEIRQYLMRKSKLIKYPAYVYDDLYLVRKTYSNLAKKTGEYPSLKEVANTIKMDEKKVKTLLNLPHISNSLDETITNDDNITLEEAIVDNTSISPIDSAIDSVMKETLKVNLEDCLNELPLRDSAIIKLRFGIGRPDGEGKTLKEIGKEFGLTKERIRQIEARALNIIHDNMYSLYMTEDLAREKRKYKAFKDYSKEEIDLIVNTLPEEKKKIYEERFSEKECSQEIKNKYYLNVYPSIKRRLAGLRKNSTNKIGYIESLKRRDLKNEEVETMKKRGRKVVNNIYEYFKDYSKEEIDAVVEDLDDKSKEMITKRFNSKDITTDVISAFNSSTAYKIRNRLKKIRQENIEPKEVLPVSLNDEEINNIFKTPLFQEKTRQLPYETMIVVALRLGFVGGKEYKSADIAKFLGIEKDTVNALVTDTLKTYKKDIINMFYNVESSNKKAHIKNKNR